MNIIFGLARFFFWAAICLFIGAVILAVCLAVYVTAAVVVPVMIALFIGWLVVEAIRGN